MPKLKENILKFKNSNRSLKVPFVIYADFESMFQKLDKCQPSDESSCTNAYQKHTPISFANYIKYCNKDYKPPIKYFGTGAVKVFYEKLKRNTLYIARNYYDKNVPLIPSIGHEKLAFQSSTVCHICEEPFNSDSEKVVDHDHLMGKFRGATHNECNLKYQNPRFIPIFFHNLNNYDSHLFVKHFSEDESEIKLIPNTEEKYISFSKVLRYNSGKVDEKGQPIINKIESGFRDSFRFMPSSLDKLSKNLEKISLKSCRNFFRKNT
jgi:hypothetical protein